MNTASRSLALVIVAVFLGSLASGMMAELYQPAIELEEEPVVQNPSQATSPGHVVFGQYISSDNCGHCSKTGGGSDAHHAIKQNHPDEYVYITYMSASFGDTDTARAGNVAPYNWPWSTGGAPDAYFGDRNDKRQQGASSNYDTYDSQFSSGGGMHSTVNDYGMSAAVSQNGGNYDISISYKYKGSGTPASNMKLYAALVDKDCTGYSYSSGIPHGYNCWMAWLTAGDTYKSKGAGSGTAFHSVSVSSTEATETWTSVPTSVVPGGISKAIVVAALMSGNQVSVGGSSPHVYHAIDSTMGPKMDISVSGLTVTNDQGTDSYVRGDTVTLEADVKNTGDLDYTSGGSLEFFYKNGATITAIDTVSIPTLNVAPGSPYLTGTATFDTSNLPSNVWSTNFGARLTGITGDMASSNNVQEIGVNHDRAPLSKTPQVLGDNVVQRGESVEVLAKGDPNDNVDDIDSMSFEIEVSAAGANLWDSSLVSGGETVLYRDSPQEGRQYFVTPTATMSAGDYDVRTRSVDSRGQTSDWSVVSDMFELANGRPLIVADPVPTVMCDTSTKVSMVGHVSDPETPLGDLVITSSSENFVAWHADSEEIEVLFPFDNGCPLGQKGIEVKVDDGGDYSDTGELPYGTLLFNVIENGQPRWAGLPIQVIDEGGSGLLTLSDYLSDTDDNGQPADTSALSIEILENSNPEVFTVELRDKTLGFETVDDDVNGETTVKLRASDGVQWSDQTITLRVNPINDAPRLDLTDIEEFSLKTNRQKIINLNSRLTDVDSPQGTYWVNNPQSTETGSARLVTGDLILNFEEVGVQTVTISTTDGYATNSYEITVNVFDSLDFYVSKTDDGSGHLFVDMMNYTYESQTPTASFKLTESAPTFTVISVTWSLCNELSGTCDGFWEYDLDMSRSNTGWTQEMNIPSSYGDGGFARVNGMRDMDYIGLTVQAVDDTGQDYKTRDTTKWLTTESLPEPAEMEEVLLDWYVGELIDDIAEVEEQLADPANTQDKASLEARLMELNTKFDAACEDTRANCPVDEVQGSTSGEEDGMNMNLILIVIGVLIVAALLGLMFIRGGGGQPEETKWNEANLPVHDAVANSMYGGAQDIFQQPVAPVAAVPPIAAVAPPPAPVAAPAGPPLPPTGLPAGWTMEQWTYYGQQYLDQMNNQ
ncbi:MAG: hypothetical protein CMB74_05590 [Euryarchaeota archaeon]|nr:hypothetical protein [Euryarchaeota archaeon]